MKTEIVYVMPKDGEQISKELGITRQAVSQSIKRGMEKCYTAVAEMNQDKSPFQVACHLMVMFNVNEEEETRKFIKLFPPRTRRLIVKDAVNYDKRKGCYK
jgi:predicted transcriptional regulator